jgi:hypoxanthine phosphoribosyltransferase
LRELSWSGFAGLSQELARTLSARFEPDLVVGVAKGGVFVGGAIASVLHRDFFPVRISRRSRDHVRERPKIYGGMPREELKGRRVLVVDDVAASGETLQMAAELAKKAGAKEVRTAALAVKPRGYHPDWWALETEDLVIFPWDYDQVPAVATPETSSGSSSSSSSHSGTSSTSGAGTVSNSGSTSKPGSESGE